MSGRLSTSRTAVLVLAMLLLIMVVQVSPYDKAYAAGWPVVLGGTSSGTYHDRVTTHTDGKVTVGGCSYGDSYAYDGQTFSADSSVYGQIPANNTSHNTLCSPLGNVTKDGTVLMERSSTTSPEQSSLVAYSQSTLKWPAFALGNTTCGSAKYIENRLVIGSDGNIYFLAGNPNCTTYELVSLNSVSGAVRFRKNVAFTGTSSPFIQAYTNGLVVRDGSSTFRYFNYSLVEDTTKKYVFVLSSGEVVNNEWQVGLNGDVYLAIIKQNVSNPPAGCGTPGSNMYTSRIFKRTLSGTNSTVVLDSKCVVLSKLNVTPNGGIVAVGQYVLDEKWQLLIFSSTIATYSEVKVNGGYDSDNTAKIQNLAVDMGGNIVVTRNYSFSDNSTGNDKRSEVLALNSSGILMSRFSTSSWQTPQDDDDWIYSREIALANGSVYIVVCSPSYGCYSNKLYKLTFGDIQIDYPRGALLGVTAQSTTQKNYVALGDSFSSGEGVPPFYSNTDQPGGNQCHLSKLAYPELIDQDPALTLSQTAFKACSGAETRHVKADAQYADQPKQISAISANTNIITMTIGGNDIGFKSFLMQCLFLDCSTTAVKQQYFTAVANLGPVLGDTYTKALAEKSNKATLYVVGYPQLMGDSQCSHTDGWMLAFDQLVTAAHVASTKKPQDLSPGDIAALAAVRTLGKSSNLSDSQIDAFIAAGTFDFSPQEIQAAQTLVSNLNTKIKTTVGTSNSRLKFVDPTTAGSPFTGHELCSVDPDFNGLVIDFSDTSKQVYSFHPNTKGQQAYAQLVKAALG